MPDWYYRLPWVIQALYNPPLALDLLDEQGYPDHSKIAPLIIVAAILALLSVGVHLSVVMVVVLITGVYGQSAWFKFLDDRTIGAASDH